MENRFKVRFSRMFGSSFGSCRSRIIHDIVEKANFDPPKSSSFRSMDSVLLKSASFRSICKPGSSETTGSIVSSTDLLLSRRKVSERCSPFLLQGQACPPVSPVLPLKQHMELRGSGLKEETKNSESNKKEKKKNVQKKTKKKKTKKKRGSAVCPFSSSSMESTFGGSWWYSSNDEEDDEMEEETDFFFSSRSLSSDSFLSRSTRRHCPRKAQGPRRRRRAQRSSDMSLFPLQGKAKDSFAVVKKSTNPYNDFRTSMVEMIVEKQIFSAKDLEQLLLSYLSLNSHHHHRVIVEVFTEILEALFPDRVS